MANEVAERQETQLITKEEQDFIAKYYEMKAQFTSIEENIKERLIDVMRNREGHEPLKIGNIKVTYKNGYYKNSVDTNALKEQGLYDSFLKQSYVKDSVSISVIYDE